jgi:tetratricopeptide (TPR) repeat protein
MGQKFFISFTSADRTKTHWIACTLKEAGHEAGVYDWEIPAGGNVPLWMNNKLAWADRLIAVISPDYIRARYSPIEWASQIWNDLDGTKGSVIPVIVRPTCNIPPLLRGLSQIDLTNCSETEARHRLIKGVDMPAPPPRKPAFEKIIGEAPDSQHTGPADKPTFQVTIYGDLVVGITFEQHEAAMRKRGEEISAEETKNRIQWQQLMERATSAEKESLQSKIAAAESDKRVLESESKAVADRLTNLQASYEGLVQRLAEANAALQSFAPSISKHGFAQAQEMLSGGDVLGAERKFVEIADKLSKIPDQDAEAARAIFEAGKLAEERIDWRAANTHYARAARLQPSNWQYIQSAGTLADKMGDYATAVSFNEAALSIMTSEFGPEAHETATALNNLALTYNYLARYIEAEPLYRRAIEIGEKVLGKDHRDVATGYNNLALLLQAQGKYDQAEPLYRLAIEIHERALGKNHPDVARDYNNLANLLQRQGKYDQAEPLYRQAIEIDERVLGKDHPDVARDYHNLAGLLQAQGKYDQAEPLYRQAIEIREKALGKDHPNVAGDYNNFALLLQAQGKYDQAEPLYRLAIEIHERVKDHPNVAADYNNFALLLQAQGKYDEAEPRYRRAIEIDERVLGKDHPDVARDYNNLALLLQDQGKYDEAEPLYRRAIEIFQNKFGLDHSNTLKARKNYDRLQELKKTECGERR